MFFNRMRIRRFGRGAVVAFAVVGIGLAVAVAASSCRTTGIVTTAR